MTKEKAGFTPGPWGERARIAEGPNNEECIEIWHPLSDETVAYVPFSSWEPTIQEGDDRAEANARLIAAAPEMAELVRSALSSGAGECLVCAEFGGHAEGCPWTNAGDILAKAGL